MKKIIIFALLFYLVFMSLVYAGFFRDYSNPLAVTRYYLECLRSKEWFLTYRVCKPEAFQKDYGLEVYYKYKLALVRRISINLLSQDSKNALVQARFIYKDGRYIVKLVNLEKIDKVWLIGNGGLN